MFEYVCPQCSAVMDLESAPKTNKDLCCGRCQRAIDPLDASRQQGRYEAGIQANIQQIAVSQERQRIAAEQNRRIDRQEQAEERFAKHVSFVFQMMIATALVGAALWYFMSR